MASSTSAFAVVNGASTTVFSVFDGGNAELSGSLSQSSDQRLKTNIQSLDASSSLSLIDELNPVTFNWIDPNQTTTLQLGFIAQQVQQIFSNLVSTTSATALTPDGTLSLNHIGLISPIVAATYVNGIKTSPVQIDTSEVATDTVDYVATDQNGLTSTTTRIVFVEAPSIVPSNDASTTATTSASTTATQ